MAADKLNLDQTDRKILKYLIRNARIKATELGQLVGMTSAAIHQRIGKIQREEIIEDFTVRLNEKNLGYKTCAFVGIFMDRNSHYTNILDELKLVKEVVEAHYTTGGYGIFIKLYAKDNDHLMEVLNKKIQSIKGIVRTETFISLDDPIRRNVPI